ncbi:MAG: type II toxin-antitoxin system HicA family toxin [Candidatus Magnetobacterium sp. LHC-1]|uniref:Type II toxin-antitoxin system HicA family toxin n=1 Tax=Candidatus Magnetobacterium casense TaxID=1455061 RepID=A0ABS6RYM3_9BACT|nr:type II toxin-antitoxin system HicA family toxin [Nitrospirota bacterium]MBV6341744.1 type II toxin-antitoxin system HicA family toxin [Candidatus Magnetobacterium casensis]
MNKLPSVSGKQCVKALEKEGFVIRRQRSSHIVLTRDEPFAQLVVPDHKTLDKGTLRAIIRQAGLTLDTFIALL